MHVGPRCARAAKAEHRPGNRFGLIFASFVARPTPCASSVARVPFGVPPLRGCVELRSTSTLERCQQRQPPPHPSSIPKVKRPGESDALEWPEVAEKARACSGEGGRGLSLYVSSAARHQRVRKFGLKSFARAPRLVRRSRLGVSRARSSGAVCATIGRRAGAARMPLAEGDRVGRAIHGQCGVDLGSISCRAGADLFSWG